MIINEKIKIKVCSKNIKYYEAKGYTFFRKENGKYDLSKEIEINSIDIISTSHNKIKVQCNICKKIFYKNAYNRNFLSNVDYCMDCGHKVAPKTKLNNIFLDSNYYDKYYVNFSKEDLYKEIDEYIKKNGNIKGFVSNADKRGRLKTLNIDLKEACQDLGYDWFLVGRNSRTYGFKTKEEIKEYINKVISVLGHFPTCNELQKYGIWSRTYTKFYDSYKELRQEMGYEDKYTDNTGYTCKSLYEMQFANYLIKNNIKFDREKKPFNDNNFKCDFLLYRDTGEKVYVEIWGLLKKVPCGEIEIKYKQIYEKKMELYLKNRLELISFYPNDFDTINHMIKVFKQKIQLKDFKKCDYVVKNLNVKSSKNDYIDYLKCFFNDLKYLPSLNDMRNAGCGSLCKIIYRQFYNLDEFSKFIGIPTKKQWCKDNHINIHTMKPNKIIKQ